MQFSLMMTTTRYMTKPESRVVGGVRAHMIQKTVDEKGFCDLVESGHAWMPALMRGGQTRANWVSQHLLALDFDNTRADGRMKYVLFPGDAGYIDEREALSRLATRGITPLCIYRTYSATPDSTRFRVVLLLDEACEDPDVMELAISKMLFLFPEADHSCSDLSRLFFGTNGSEKVYRTFTKAGARHAVDIRDILRIPTPDNGAKRTKYKSLYARNNPNAKGNDKADTHAFIPGHVDLVSLQDSIDLLSLIQSDVGESGIRKGKTIAFHKCPICGHKDCFAFYPATNSWACFSTSNTSGRRGGRAIDYVMARNRVSFKEALALLSEPSKTTHTLK